MQLILLILSLTVLSSIAATDQWCSRSSRNGHGVGDAMSNASSSQGSLSSVEDWVSSGSGKSVVSEVEPDPANVGVALADLVLARAGHPGGEGGLDQVRGVVRR